MAKEYFRGGRHNIVSTLRSLLPLILAVMVTVALALVVLPKNNAGTPEQSAKEVALAGPFTSSAGATAIPTIGTSESGITRELTAFKTPLPTPTARQIQRPATVVPTPTPTPTPRFLPEQYVDNGGFEDGFNDWYFEPGAGVTTAPVRRGAGAIQIDTTGGFASNRFVIVPGTAYRLSAWGSLSATGDAAEIGIQYFDAYGRRLVADEPPPLIFTEPEFVRLALTFTPVSTAVSAQVYIWKPSGPEIFVADDISIRAFAHDPAIEES